MVRILIFSLCFLFSVVGKAQNEGDVLFGGSSIHDIELSFWQTNYWDTLTQHYLTDTYIPCHMTVNGVPFDSIGIKFKGNSSYNNPSDKKSFKIDMNEYISGQKIDGLKKLNLNNGFKDPTFMREKVFLDFLQNNGIPAPRCTYARVHINGTYWGLYMLVEEVNKKFLDLRFGNDTGNLFKGDPQGDLKWLGPSPSLYYPKYELKTNESQNDWSDLVAFINALNNATSQGLYDSILQHFHANTYFSAWAAHNLFVNLDSYMGSGHNYFIYHDASHDRFEWITWDVNEAFGGFQMGMTVPQLEQLSMYYIPSPSSNRPLNQKLLSNTTYKSEYTLVMCDLIHHKLDLTKLFAQIDSLADVIRPSVQSDTKKFFTNQQFEDNIHQDISVPMNPGAPVIPGLKSFIQARVDFLVAELEQQLCFASTDYHSSNQFMNVYPLPAHSHLFIDYGSSQQDILFLLDSSGKLVATYPSGTTTIDITEFASGLYILQVGNNPVIQKKIVIAPR
ncbi:MAG: CotH kinase family protein [Candidatus Competibacteraceae bacterium]|nr:CotH kinase family protein [Candidatus Competibacteraceae bacterium]